MGEAEFNELAGRIEGIGRAFLVLVDMLEKKGTVNGPRYCSALRRMENELCIDSPHCASAKRTLLETAKALDEARKPFPK